MPSSIRSDLLSPLRYDTNMRIVKCITQYGARRNARKSKGLLFYRRTIGCSAPMTREKSWRGAVRHHYGLYKKKKKMENEQTVYPLGKYELETCDKYRSR